ncbi:uncharacterized protein K02A2.6-like [Patiria miniata]|uniref:Endonuclease n=1 Tax=Patiria miniata TaxID=46514 RepID=A0A913ZWA6_PATMI|nr:uncharacterized protein K02A2.6-like [Patiria miniata]
MPTTPGATQTASSSNVSEQYKKPHINPPAHFNASAKDAAEEWKMWRQMWDNYCVLTNLASQPEAYQTALLLHSIGTEGVRIYNGMKFDNPADNQICSKILEKFDSHFLGQRQEFFERFKFNRRNQDEGEPIEQYISILRTMSKTCGLCACMKDKLLMDRLLMGVLDDKMREKMMATHDLTLTKAIEICKAVEVATVQMKAMKKEETVHKVRPKKTDKKPRQPKQRPPRKAPVNEGGKPISKRCKFCSGNHPMKKELCPAWGRTCDSCGVKNHFKKSRVCKNHRVHAVDEDGYTSSSGESVSCVTTDINSVTDDSKPVYCTMEIKGEPVKFQVDCGATINLIPKKYAMEISPARIELKMWNNSCMTAVGRSTIKLRNPVTLKKYKVNFVIVDKDLTPLIGRKAAEQMGLITINYDKFSQVHGVTPTHADFVSEYPDVFNASVTGILPGQRVHLTVSSDAEPVIRPARTVPEALKPAVKAELEKLTDRDVLAEVDEPTNWVSQMSVAKKKSGSVRICIDPGPLNKYLMREHYTLPVLNDILPELNEATHFSICDLKDGYLHCELDDESSKLTTFATPWGRYRWKRLPFGLKVSSEIFQKRLHQALDGLEGVRCVADDIIIWGRDVEEHNRRVRKLLQRCKEVGIILNREKSRFTVHEVHFLGHIISHDGLKADPSKIEAIINMKPPTSKDDVDRLRGMVNYLSKFLPSLSQVMEPINALTRKGVEWSWNACHDKAFGKLKQLLTEAPVLTYFNPEKELVIHTDASDRGIGAALLQNGKPLAYASRALSDTETRYAVIEKEMLAVVFALEKWHQYTFGRHVTVYSDHKPLESIVKKPLDKAPRRLQGMLLRALAYNADVNYLQGKKNLIADPLSRSFLPYESSQKEFETVNALQYLTLPEERIYDIKQMTGSDDVLQLLKKSIQEGWPEHKNLLPAQITPYFSVRDELCVHDGLVFRGERLVIPKAMRQVIKQDLHLGHIGVEGTLRRAREYVFWPGMTDEIRQWIECCETCREYEVSQAPLPLMSHDIPERPWEKLGIDLFHHDGKDYLITVCYKSNFWEVDRLHSTTARSVIGKLKHHFGRYGIPDIIVSDNGPPFSSKDFGDFTRKWGIKHNTISPYNSKANGKAESAVKSAKKMLKKCLATGEDEDLALLNIRNTPTQGVDSSPAQRFLGRRTKTLIPTSRRLLQARGSEGKREMKQLELNQRRQAKYYNQSTKDLPSLIQGDTVRMKPFRQGEDRWKKALVLRKLDERSYEVLQDDQVYRRNREHLRKSKEPPPKQHKPSTGNTLHVPEGCPRTTDSQKEVSIKPDMTPVPPNPVPAAPPTNSKIPTSYDPTTTPTEQPTLRRSTRTRCEPAKFQDYTDFDVPLEVAENPLLDAALPAVIPGLGDEDITTYKTVESGTKRGKVILVDSHSYTYTKKWKKAGSTSSKVTWLCSVRGKLHRCAVSVHQDGNLFHAGVHTKQTHPAHPGADVTVQVKALVITKAKADISKSAGAIVEDVITTHLQPDTPAASCPNPTNLSRAANRHHQSQRPPEPRDIDLIIDQGFIPEHFLQKDIHLGCARHVVFF